MFDRFGEFDSAAEINKKAEELLAGADMDGIRLLAEENGIDKEDAEDYIDGCVKELTTPHAAAIAKLEMEAKALEIKGILDDWTGYIKDMCSEVDGMAAGVRRKGKRLSECMSRLIRYAFENKVMVNREIVRITKVTHGGKEEQMREPLYLGIPSRVDAKRIIKDYYLG